MAGPISNPGFLTLRITVFQSCLFLLVTSINNRSEGSYSFLTIKTQRFQTGEWPLGKDLCSLSTRGFQITEINCDSKYFDKNLTLVFQNLTSVKENYTVHHIMCRKKGPLYTTNISTRVVSTFSSQMWPQKKVRSMLK